MTLPRWVNYAIHLDTIVAFFVIVKLIFGNCAVFRPKTPPQIFAYLLQTEYRLRWFGIGFDR